MEKIKTKIKLAIGAALKHEEIAQLKADIIKMEANLAPNPAPIPAQAPAPVTLSEVKTKDGKIISYEGELVEGTMVNVMDEATGLPIPAPNGSHELEDGTIITTEEGIVKSVKKVEAPAAVPAPSIEEMKTQLSAHKKEIESDYETKLSTQKKEFNDKLDELSKIVLSQAKIIDTFINTPIETVQMESQNPKGELSKEEYEKLSNFEKVKYNRSFK